MLQKTYSIYSDDLVNNQLFIEIGNNHLACWCKKDEENKFTAFEFFQCDDYDASAFENVINEAKLFSKLLTLDVSDTTVFWFNSTNLIFPLAINADKKFIKENFYLVFGSDDSGKLISRNYEDCLIVTYVEKYLYAVAENIFSKATFKQALYFNKADENIIKLFFYPCHFSITIYKEGKLQFFQVKNYTKPEDVLYAVLNIFQQYKIEKNIKIISGGFIVQNSKLFEILYQYLEGFEIEVIDETLFISSEFKEYPAHYFLPYANYLL